jgi:glycosyltransferase involved in cell wall biosynthesis
MQQIPHPIIGYTGAISGTRLDARVIAHIAEQLPNCSVVLVGPLIDGFEADSLKKFSNVYFLGRKDPADIPSYVYQFDVCINPQQVNQLTMGNYPRKADEYLAMGKPMVATRTEAMEMFADHVFLCTSKEDYVAEIKRILTDSQFQSALMRKQRREFALTHTWENSVRKLGEAFLEFEQKQNRHAALGQA